MHFLNSAQKFFIFVKNDYNFFGLKNNILGV